MNLDVVAVVGGAGFIGSHFVDALLANEKTKRVVIYDNFSSGREWHFEQHKQDSRLEIVRGQIRPDSASGRSSIREARIASAQVRAFDHPVARIRRVLSRTIGTSPFQPLSPPV